MTNENLTYGGETGFCNECQKNETCVLEYEDFAETEFLTIRKAKHNCKTCNDFKPKEKK